MRKSSQEKGKEGSRIGQGKILTKGIASVLLALARSFREHELPFRIHPALRQRSQTLAALPVSHCLWAGCLGQDEEECGGCNISGEQLCSRMQVFGERGGCKLLAATAAGGWVQQPRKAVWAREQHLLDNLLSISYCIREGRRGDQKRRNHCPDGH